MTFWASDYLATKTASIIGRAVGHTLTSLGNFPGAIGADRRFNQILDDANLTDEQRQLAEDRTGVLSGLRSGVYSAGGSMLGMAPGLALYRAIPHPNARSAGRLLAMGGGLGGGYLGGQAAGGQTARHRLRELEVDAPKTSQVWASGYVHGRIAENTRGDMRIPAGDEDTATA
jgi:hypothetical protein